MNEQPVLSGFYDLADLEYEFAEDDLSHIELHVAIYDMDWYEGSAFVVYRDLRDGKFYEVHGSHCSCFGLEKQWTPEEIHWGAMLMRNTFVRIDRDDPLEKRVRERIEALASEYGEHAEVA